MPTAAIIKYGKAMRYKIPEFRPAASVDPAACPDSAVALHMAHCAHVENDTKTVSANTRNFFIGGSRAP